MFVSSVEELSRYRAVAAWSREGVCLVSLSVELSSRVGTGTGGGWLTGSLHCIALLGKSCRVDDAIFSPWAAGCVSWGSEWDNRPTYQPDDPHETRLTRFCDG